MKKKDITNDTGKHNQTPNKPRTIEEMNEAFEKARKGYEFAMQNGHQDKIEAIRDQYHTGPRLYRCSVCTSLGPKGGNCENCDEKSKGVYGGSILTNEEIWDGIDWMCSEGDKKNKSK